MTHAELLASRGEVSRSERRAVVGEQALYGDIEPDVVRHRIAQEPRRTWSALIGVHGREGAQARFTERQVAAQPLACCRIADAVHDRGLRQAQSTLSDVLNHLDSTNVGESGILMAVRSAEFLEKTGVWRFQVSQTRSGWTPTTY